MRFSSALEAREPGSRLRQALLRFHFHVGLVLFVVADLDQQVVGVLALLLHALGFFVVAALGLFARIDRDVSDLGWLFLWLLLASLLRLILSRQTVKSSHDRFANAQNLFLILSQTGIQPVHQLLLGLLFQVVSLWSTDVTWLNPLGLQLHVSEVLLDLGLHLVDATHLLPGQRSKVLCLGAMGFAALDAEQVLVVDSQAALVHNSCLSLDG